MKADDRRPVPRSRTAFSSPDFRWFFLARLVNFLGTNIMLPTLGWQVYQLTRDPLSVGPR